jgi:hypothetical protein
MAGQLPSVATTAQCIPHVQQPLASQCPLLARRRSQRMSALTSAFGGEPEMLRMGLIRRS